MTSCAFRADRLHRIAALEDRHFWFVGRRRLVKDLVHRHLRDRAVMLDVGCGTGRTLREVAAPTGLAVGFDYRGEHLRHDTSTGRRISLGRADIGHLPVRSATADAVLALDVLEHVDDVRALAEIRRVLRPGGAAIVTVPAFPMLWSYRDVDAGHRRRYTRKGLRAAVDAAGFELADLRYFQFLLFPLVLLTRLLGRRSESIRDAEERQMPAVNGIMTALTLAEVAAQRIGLRYPWGSSLVAVLRKPAA